MKIKLYFCQEVAFEETSRPVKHCETSALKTRLKNKWNRQCATDEKSEEQKCARSNSVGNQTEKHLRFRTPAKMMYPEVPRQFIESMSYRKFYFLTLILSLFLFLQNFKDLMNISHWKFMPTWSQVEIKLHLREKILLWLVINYLYSFSFLFLSNIF